MDTEKTSEKMEVESDDEYKLVNNMKKINKTFEKKLSAFQCICVELILIIQKDQAQKVDFW